MAFGNVYRGKTVIVTGHTGFKGSWLCEWLLELGARVVGVSLPCPATPTLYSTLGLERRVEGHAVDIRDIDRLSQAIVDAQPDFVFHLAAQALVRHSYDNPIETFAVNTLGTAHVLQAIRRLGKPCVVVVVTTDKCYENREWLHSYREEDPVGGHDPYSASKGAAELVVTSYRRSFFSHPGSSIVLASARAGNVIGGGDWADHRIVPDCVKALSRAEPIRVRNRLAIRPWQHVLEPLSGYLWLGMALSNSPAARLLPFPRPTYEGAFNFGPNLQSNCSVQELVERVLRHWPGRWEDQTDPSAPHEAQRLNLATDKAFHLLHWTPTWSLDEAVRETILWYRQFQTAKDFNARQYSIEQIKAYVACAREKHSPWALD